MCMFRALLATSALISCSAFVVPVSRLSGPRKLKLPPVSSTRKSLSKQRCRINDSTFAVLFAIGTSLILSSPLSLGANAFDATIYNHDYADPFHPLCERHIQVASDGSTFHYSGTAVGPKDDPVLRGCSQQEILDYKLRKGAFDGVILQDGKISAGDGIHEGVWESAGSTSTNLGYEDKDGIRWNDGNKWVVLEDSVPSGWEQGFKNFTLLYIAVSLLAGAKELLKRAKDATSSG